ncbi:MAG: metallophosphoesterase family protein [Mediterranea sp.]|jgi:hypothetical protein|nr:metallophosphoesterase family protein [Mediterranea sp.]
MKKIMLLIAALAAATALWAQKQQVELRFDANGAFKIVQFTDIHYVVDKEESQKSIRMMNDVLDREHPNLVVFTGDIITCRPQQQGWDEVLAVPERWGIPYAVVLGNHDDEHDLTRRQIMDYITAKPFCLSRRGPDFLKGEGNFVLEVKDAGHRTAALVYCMDSNAYAEVDGQKGYDSFGPDQVRWYQENNAHYTRQNGGKPYPALAFFHIPLQEYTLLNDTSKNYVKPRKVYGRRTEKECPGILNTGMFAAMVTGGDVMGTFVGHDHNNEYIGYLNGICLGYGRFSGSKNTYTDIGYGARVIVMKQGQRRFDTWIRTSDGQEEQRISYPDAF